MLLADDWWISTAMVFSPATNNEVAAVTAMVPSSMALLAVVGTTALTGWLQTTDLFWGSEALEELHEIAANLILVLAAFHVGGVLYESWRHRENLITAMIDGKKRAE